MVNLVFRFPGGRYHATPWGNHVNEGLIEWPPSPWRIARALLATGFSKLGWREPPPAARLLVDGLASSLPRYRLPEAIAVHTRHFMPTDSKRPEERTKVFDAFAHVGKNAELAVIWPIALSVESTLLLGELVTKLSYLGRAESVVEARLVGDAELPEGSVASPNEINRPGTEPIALLAPMTSTEYGAWLAEAATSEHTKGGGDKRKLAQDSPYPLDALAAVLIDTSFLQKHGWTQPPGSRRVHYYRRPLATTARRVVSRAPRVASADTALLALASDTRRGDVLPLFTRALPQAELLHMGLVSQIGEVFCPELAGRDREGVRLLGHRHATLVPLDLDVDGHLDHFLVHAPVGFGADAQRALRAIRRTYAKGEAKPLFVTLAGIGTLDDFLRLGRRPVDVLGESRVWVSRTPFVPPRHVKPTRHTLEDQVQAELAARALPPATRIDLIGHDASIALGFHRFIRARRDPKRQPPASRFFGLRIEFEHPARGPISLGYASHFGLGLFVPASAKGEKPKNVP
jgi:CRISPR-associated protein Csb2